MSNLDNNIEYIHSKLKPISGDIKIIYTIKNDEKSQKHTSIHKTYEDFGEWICKNFYIINIIDIDTN